MQSVRRSYDGCSESLTGRWRRLKRETERPGNGPIDRPAARKMAIWSLSSSDRCE
jgi:hypothetical protein